MKVLTNDEFYKSLSDAEWDKAEAIQSEIGKLLDEGLSAETGLGLVRAVMEIRTEVLPAATVEGVLEAVLLVGLTHIRYDAGLAAVQGPIKGKRNSSKRGSTLK